jgi:hypothetical protein
MSKTVISKQEAIALLRRWGMGHLVEAAQRELPDTIDLVRDQDLLARYGMTRGQLIDRAGGSP